MTAVIEPNAADLDTRQPHDDGAERIVLGAMMLTAAVVDEVVDVIRSSADFYRPAHQAVYAAIVAAAGAAEPTDPTVIAATLSRTDELKLLPGGAAYLADLVESVPVAATARWHARRVADLAIRRRIITAGMRLVAQAAHGADDVEALADAAQQAIHEATAGRDAGSMIELGAAIDPFLDDLFSGRQPEGAVPTGLADLDRLLGGLHPGQLIVVGARPGIGKSVAGIDFARRAATSAHRAGIPSVIFSLEMSQEEVIARIVAAECGVNLSAIRRRELHESDRARIEAKRDQLRRTPVLVDGTPNVTLHQIRSGARRAVQRYGVGLIVVDYLQLMTAGRRSESRQQDVAEFSRGLKLLAKELRVPVVALSQLNRSSESRSDRRPALSDLRESGAVEQDADVVILLHRDDYYDPESPRAGEIDFIVAKHRNGPTDTVTMVAQLDRARIVDMGIL